ncbi:MAG TPA: hypothetical protein VHZ24_05765 [Pirellulales bacterium]|jgi:FtsH-binding integral membrane protein|nr:hypothetical protein [Pirellulales bacterium]
MSNYLFVLGSTALTALSWGVYGPLMREGQVGMGGSHLLPFICVGIAYFLIAVIVPGAMLRARGESGSWTTMGIAWSFGAGVVTAVGALGIILALTNGGSPIYVMPLVFGCAPVVNTVVAMYMSRTYRQAGPIFYAGLILVIAGAVTVLMFNPAKPKPRAVATVVEGGKSGAQPAAQESVVHEDANRIADLAKVSLFVALTALCWGSYGPLLHKGQVAMQGSRLRPFICVGMAYFLIAVLAPLVLRAIVGDHGELSASGVLWSLGAGSAGAIGSLGIILAFTFGGKPVYVMPLVFGGAPVINTLVSIMTAKDLGEISPFFYAGLIVVVAGAVTVLVFAPKPAPHAPAGKKAAAAGNVPAAAHR